MDCTGSGNLPGKTSRCRLLPAADGTVKLHLFLDRFSLEVFGNDGSTCVTTRMYPDPDSPGVRLFVTDGAVQMKSLDVWTLKSAW
ncbi:GH32 C-terminal domain-containing protein [Paenibacillus sp.]|uniref:GH32 C-terminal domain-containing protein n=1 Tax=Paenibacillus sp. TaxID=58172 RepID=UPI0039C934F0